MSVVISICYTFTSSFHHHCVLSSLHLMFADSKIYIWDVKLPLSVWSHYFSQWVYNSVGFCCFVVFRFSRLRRDQQSQFYSSGSKTQQMFLSHWHFCFCRPFVTVLKKKKKIGDWPVFHLIPAWHPKAIYLNGNVSGLRNKYSHKWI